ncbi:MAG: zinc ribbon domain-containing protein [Methanobrevibacter sp.]|nr:zinc ribbon domain-containing protein [Methanobrevibacter sp.]
MKKCPECGNPSYDGAPVCGNCGYKFPKPKAAVRRESIFEGQPRVEKKTKKEKPKVKKPSNEPSVLDIIKEKKLIIGTILIITLIVICGIFITGSNKNVSNTIATSDLANYDASDFSFKYPANWQQVNLTDSEHETAIFFKDENNTIIEFYNISSSATSLKEINQQRISLALDSGDALELLETVTLDGRNGSNIILENADGNYTRYVSMFTDGKLYVFKISGSSINSITSDGINSMVNSADIK